MKPIFSKILKQPLKFIIGLSLDWNIKYSMDNINHFLNVQYKMNASNFIISNWADFVFNFIFSYIYIQCLLCARLVLVLEYINEKIPYSYGIHIASAMKKNKAGKKAERVKS